MKENIFNFIAYQTNRAVQKLLLMCFFLMTCSAGNTQVITANDSFEGTPQPGIPPEYWENCEDGHSTTDTQPGAYYNELAPSQGNSYISLVTRAVTSLAGTVETVYAELIKPIEKGACYNYQIDLSLSASFNASAGFDTYYFDNPSVLQVIGYNGSCDSPESSEVLWESEVVSNLDWNTFDIEIIAEHDTYSSLALRPMFYPEDNWQNSALMIDHLRMAVNNEWLVDEGGMLSLSGNPENIQWYYNNSPVSGANGIDMPVLGSGLYSVTFVSENGCFMRSEQEVVIDYDALNYFPNPTTDVVTIEYFSQVEGIVELDVYNDIGQLVRNFQFNSAFGKNNIVVDLSEFARETFFLRLTREEMDQEVLRIVKMN